MRRNFLLVLILSTCLSNLATAQDCGGVDEKKDAFSGKTVKSARIFVGNLTTKWAVDLEQSEGATYMKWSIAVQGEYNQQLSVGTVLMLKLEDASIITLKTIEPTSPVTKATGGGAGTVNIFTTYILKFSLSRDDLAAMAKSPISDFKIDVAGQMIKNPKIKDKQMKKIMEASACLFSTF